VSFVPPGFATEVVGGGGGGVVLVGGGGGGGVVFVTGFTTTVTDFEMLPAALRAISV
jgi:hypothetical protein